MPWLIKEDKEDSRCSADCGAEDWVVLVDGAPNKAARLAGKPAGTDTAGGANGPEIGGVDLTAGECKRSLGVYAVFGVSDCNAKFDATDMQEREERKGVFQFAS